MTAELDIVNKLKEALKTSCDDAFAFSSDETELISAEYLITVNAAKAIKELNDFECQPYKICLENSTKEFSSACTPLLKKEKSENFLGYRHILRTKNNSQRSGKIDIAIYTTSGYLDTPVPLCAIEIKGFDPSKNLIIKDLERNTEYFNLTSPTGSSNLPFTVFVALHSYKRVWTDEKEQKNIEKVKKRYQGYINENPNLNKLSHHVDVMTTRRGTIPDPADPYIREFGLQGDEDYQYVGVVITTKKN